MPQLISIDAGNFETKVIHERGYDLFSSSIGEWRERKSADSHSDNDMEFHINNKYDDIKGFAGPLASIESEYGGTIYGASKNHVDARIRILLAIARNLSDFTVDIIVTQPYISHTDIEKKEIIDSLKGEHLVTINGKQRNFIIDRVIVGIEGAMAFWTTPSMGNVNVIDIGSGTVNCINFKDKRIVDRKSSTLEFGTETSGGSLNISGMSNAIFKNMASKWNKDDTTLLCGGASPKFYDHLKKYFNNLRLVEPLTDRSGVSVPLEPKFANSVGAYKVAKKAYAKV